MTIEEVRAILIENSDILKSEYVSQQSFLEEIQTPLFAFRNLAKVFRYSGLDDRLLGLLGMILARLTKEEFIRLQEMRLFFLIPNRMGTFLRWGKIDNDVSMILLDSPLFKMTDSECIGTLTHEICHAILKHEGNFPWGKTYREMETEADTKGEQLGFGYEILSVRKYLKKRGE